MTAADLVRVLSECHLLEPAQMEKVNRALQGRSADAKVLARELLKQGWVTAFQINLVLNGRGAELVLGPYVLLDRLGEGGMGQVYKARHQLMNRIVALKVIRNDLLANSDAVQRFYREIRLAAQLDHPHLVRAHDAAQVGNTHFLVMEYAEGIDLQRLVQQAGPLPVAQACVYIRQAALGLQYAAEHQMVHRDIKPSNLQATGQGQTIKILDLGLARSRAAGEIRNNLTQVSTVMGTPDYIAPEQIADPRGVDVRADIYSLGCTFYFLLAGRPPFPDGAWDQKLAAHRTAEPPPIEQLRPDVPPAVGAILRKMMAKRPEERYATPVAVADALLVYCQQTAAVPVLVGAMAGGAASLPESLVNRPASSPETGWTLPVGSTVTAPRGPAASADILDMATILTPSPTPQGHSPNTPYPRSPVEATMLAPAPSAPVEPPRRRGIGWLVTGVAVGLILALFSLAAVVVVVGIVLLRPSTTESSNTDKSAETDKDKGAETDKDKLKPPQPKVLVNEDFSEALKQKQTLPTDWKGDAFRVVKDNEEPCLEVNKEVRNLYFVTLPPVSLNGNFSIEAVCMLDAYHHLVLRLENRKTNAILPINIDFAGKVLIADDPRTAPPGYKPYAPMRFLVTREGKKLRVFLNDEVVGDKDLDAVTAFESLQIGLIAGRGVQLGRPARVYRLKVVDLGSDSPDPSSKLPLPSTRGKGK